MRIKKGDNVIIITGKDKGKSGAVVRAFPERDMVLVEGINMKKKHKKQSGQAKQHSGIIDIAHPLHVSNVMVKDPKGGKPTRVGKQLDEKKGKFVRIARKSGASL